MSPLDADYIIVGGGITGCVIASRLKQNDQSLSITVLEAGPNPQDKHDVATPMGGFALQGSELDWQYLTEPNANTGKRTHTLTAGKTLGGGSILNYGGWSRGDAADYDTWSRLTGYQQWSYANLLPYFQRSERFDAAEKNLPELAQRGFSGPMKITSVSASSPERRYPLGEPLCKAWGELGVKVSHGCTGRNQGLSEWLENWDNGRRQAVHQSYPLKGVRISTGRSVRSITLSNEISEPTGSSTSERPKATGVVLETGEEVRAHREVLLCAGAVRSPHLLMVSGVGPNSLSAEKTETSSPSISSSQTLTVGMNMIDHFALYQLFKLHHWEKGLALGHPDLNDPAFSLGLPSDFVVNEGLPRSLLEKALDEDGITGAERDALLEPNRCFVEILALYHPLSAPVPADGTYISSSVMLTIPSSRGQVSRAQDPSSHTPVIEPGYFATALDRLALIHGVRRLLHLMLGTDALRPYVESEVPPPGHEKLDPRSSDAEIEARIRATGLAHYHTTGTCALGSVVDEQLHVKGVENLRVCDASVLPTPVGGHPQATLYGVAEKAAEMILQASGTG